MADQLILDENPLSLELTSLRASVARFQEEAHASAVKLQRHSLDSVRVHERAVHLERENDLLKAELAVLRANPHPDSVNSSDSRTQVQELTLSLRRLSHKISLTEEALLAKTTEIVRLNAEVLKAKAIADNAYELGARVRGREEAGKVRESDLERRIMQLEEDMKMADMVIKEYAALVREMESKSTARSSEPNYINGHTTVSDPSGTSSSTPKIIANALLEAKWTHERLITQFQADSQKLQTELHNVRAKLEIATSQLDAQRKVTGAVENELGRTQTELEELRLEDGTAAKMVSRYMQFSQTSTNNLLSTLSKLKARHEGTLSTISSQYYTLSNRIRSVEVQNERLRSALDELGGEIMKESYGRRREVALRIKMGRREERLIEGLRRWVRGGEEKLGRLTHAREYDTLVVIVQDARILLENLDEGVFDEESALTLSGDKAREFLINNGLEGLLDELRGETEKRVNLEKRLASTYGQSARHGTASPKAIEQPLDAPPIESSGPDATGQRDNPPQVPEKMRIHSPLSRLPSTLPSPVPQKSQHIDKHHEDRSSKTPIDDHDHSHPDNQAVGVMSGIQAESETRASLLQLDVLDGATADLSPNDSPLTPTNMHPSSDAKEMEPVSPATDYQLEAKFQEPSPPSEEVAEIRNWSPSISPPLDPIQGTALSASDEANSDTFSLPSISDAPTEQIPFTPSDASTLTASSSSLLTPPEVTNSNSFPSSEFPATTSEYQPHDVTLDEKLKAPPHPLLADLARISKRYDDLQRAFRDCHLALEGLQVSLNEARSSSSHSIPIPTEVLNGALGRLDDYTEDARVELEIRVGDEVLLAKGYEALLSVPGAMTIPKTMTINGEDSQEDNDAPTQTEVERQVDEFVSGADPAVRKAREIFTKKLVDVQHDIAALKRAIFDPKSFMSLPPHSLSIDPPTQSTSTSSLVSPPLTRTDPPTTAGGWSSWIRSPSRPSSPAPPALGPAPTFGNIMTTPRLRHTPSSGNMQHQQPQRPRRSSFFGLAGGANEPLKDPLAVLELKVPMPSFGFGGYSTMLSPTSPMTPLILATPTRTRTVSSTMYMLGLGPAGGSGAGGRMARSASSSMPVSGSASPLGVSRQNSQASLGPKHLANARDAQKHVPVKVEEEDTDTAEEDLEDEDDMDIE